MTVSIFSAAKRLCEKSGWSLTNLEIQKMCYLAHMFFMGRSGGTALVDGSFEAWDLGPVHPDLYHHVKEYRSSPIKEKAFRIHLSMSEDHDGIRFLDDAVTSLPRNRLVAITHWEEGAWAKNYRPGIKGIVIPNADILAEFRKRQDVADRSEQ